MPNEVALVAVLSALSTTALIPAAVYLSRNRLNERLRASLQKENSKFMDEMQWERKTQERAEKVAEYLAVAKTLNSDASDEAYVTANKLSFELAMWLPEEIYRELT